MAIKNSQPIRYTPKGLCDAFDATDAFPGASQLLANLIFDSSNPELMVPRPGVTSLINLSGGISFPRFISVHAAIGTRIFGMVASSRNIGRDEPFCFDTATHTLIPISGVTAANTPLSPPTSGDWEPPTMASVGVFILITHPGFSGAGTDFFGVIDLTVPTAPAWSSAACTTNALTARPSAVANLNNRAYFAVGNQVQYTDPLSLTRTSANQALVIGDSSAINALSGLSIQTTSSGVLSALTIFKPTQVWQVTGDPVTTDLAENFISLTVGTSAPRSVAQSPAGLYFLSTGGPYFIDPLGTLRLLTHRADNVEPDLQAPFINATPPTRWAGTYNSSVYRVCGPTVIRGVAQVNDYWFDERKRRWNGPHSFSYDCGGALAGVFVLTSANYPGQLLVSQSSPTLASVYTDLGAAYNVTALSSTLPKVGDMFTKQVAESQIELGGSPRGATYTITAQDEQGVTIESATITVPSLNVPRWGSAVWGAFRWASAQNVAPATYPVPWAAPLVFEKMQLKISVVASANVQIGTFYARYQKTGYMVMR